MLRTVDSLHNPAMRLPNLGQPWTFLPSRHHFAACLNSTSFFFCFDRADMQWREDSFPDGTIPCTIPNAQLQKSWQSLSISCPEQCGEGSLWAKQKQEYNSTMPNPPATSGLVRQSKSNIKLKLRYMEQGTGLACQHFGHSPASFEFVMDPQVCHCCICLV